MAIVITLFALAGISGIASVILRFRHEGEKYPTPWMQISYWGAVVLFIAAGWALVLAL